VSCSYGTFLEHPISVRVGKWLPPNRGATSTRQKIGARGYGDLMVISCLDTPHAGLVAMNFPAASLGSGFET
jgi:hypothetical protein